MKRWYKTVYSAEQSGDTAMFQAVLDAADAYEASYESAKDDYLLHGRLESISARLPGLTEQRFAQLQDIESILEHLETKEKKAAVEKTKYFLEHYNRTLSDRVAREYAETSDEVQLILSVMQRIAYVRNLFLGLMKGLEVAHYQITNLTKLRCSGLEDAEISLRS